MSANEHERAIAKTNANEHESEKVENEKGKNETGESKSGGTMRERSNIRQDAMCAKKK
jgi:hypothetical protein